jgi:hypothetical protein
MTMMARGGTQWLYGGRWRVSGGDVVSRSLFLTKNSAEMGDPLTTCSSRPGRKTTPTELQWFSKARGEFYMDDSHLGSTR